MRAGYFPLCTMFISVKEEHYRWRWIYVHGCGMFAEHWLFLSRPAEQVPLHHRLENPTNTGCVKKKRILPYLKGTMDLGVSYKSKEREKLVAFSDADHGMEKTVKQDAQLQECNAVCGGAISWSQSTSNICCNFHNRAEILAATEAIIRGNTKFSQSIPTLMVEDSIKLSKTPNSTDALNAYLYKERLFSKRISLFFGTMVII
ncbi:uncharacterized protein LOC123314124 [Coccinella septempunctata]|uniref:uncharacterized protein LOC123314124 n=1 Tax=Coccinella septempunctata TaxID=41139 RepID=UPI001D06CA4C|nr:uncharacterized protein LOC123314124 [Coccinella septempunctata]